MNEITATGQYIILVREPDIYDDTVLTDWHNIGEGPWTDYDDAEAFARAEVGAEWIIARVASIEGKRA